MLLSHALFSNPMVGQNFVKDLNYLPLAFITVEINFSIY